MKILVTGGTGYIGRELVNSLVSDHEVRCLVRNNSDISKLPDSVELFYGDITEPETLEGVCEDIEIVIHLAAKPSMVSSKSNQEMIDVNVKGTLNLLREVKKFDVEKLIFYSSIAVFGEVDNKNDLESVEDYNPETIYGKSKLKVEEMCRKFCRGQKIELAILRPSMVIDFEEPNKELSDISYWVRQGLVPLIGLKKRTINIVHRENLVRKTKEVIEYGISGTLIINDSNIYYSQLVDKVSEELDTKCLKFRLPFLLLYPLSGIYMLLYSLIGKEAFMDPIRLDRMRRNVIG